MKQILLINTNIYTLIDDGDFELISKYRWYLHKAKNKLYAKTFINKKSIYLHKFLIKCNNTIDHKDRNGLNNQKDNLREATYSQQNINRNVARKGKYIGVTLVNTGKYRAKISVNNNSIHLGYFYSEELAALAYNQAATRYYGEFARLNEFN